MIRKPICWIPVAVSYAVLAWFVFFVINPLCYNIFQHPAFTLTADFFWSKVCDPGGLSEYFQTFIDQFTMFRFWGTLFLVAEVLLTAFLCARYVRKITGDNQFVTMLVYMLPVAVSIVAWTDVKYPFAINMQVLLLAAALNLHQALSKYDWNKYITPLLAIAVYHACGPVALYTFALCGIVAYALKPDKRDLASVVGAVVVAAIWPLIIYKFVLPIKPEGAFYDMRPQKLMFTSFKLSPVLYMLYVCLPASVLIGLAYNKIGGDKKKLFVTIAAVALIFGTAAIARSKHDNYTERIGFRMEVAAYNKDWNWILNYMKNNSQLFEKSNYERYVNFYYDMAAAQNNQLVERMFFYPHLLGETGLYLDKPMATYIGYPAAMFYYNMGFAASALHFAFEAQSTFTNSHYVMQMVIDCLIIIGDYRTAELFLDKYDHNMFSGKFVADRRNFIEGKPNTELSAQFVNEARKRHPHNDFYMQNRLSNMAQVFMANKDNNVASQYILCTTLLQGDLDSFVNLLLSGYYNYNVNNLPRPCQEALLIYKSTTKNVNPEVEKFKIQQYVEAKFGDFVRLVNSKPNNMKELIEKNYPNTYWKYYTVDSPKVTGVSID
ncbi:MAG: hypothetical protein J6W13_01235 [Salinivirgaceae bacterium]|nr:hypothetical protein [Salinivirgaceae bacterium]